MALDVAREPKRLLLLVGKRYRQPAPLYSIFPGAPAGTTWHESRRLKSSLDISVGRFWRNDRLTVGTFDPVYGLSCVGFVFDEEICFGKLTAALWTPPERRRVVDHVGSGERSGPDREVVLHLSGGHANLRSYSI